MKTAKFTSLILAIFFAAIFTFTACAGDGGAGGASISLSEKQLVITATSTGGSLEDTMLSLKETGVISFEGTQGDYGFYITSLNGYTPDESANEYWAIYTTLGEYEGVSYSNADYGTFEYADRTCCSASYGISGLPMVEGEIYVLVVETY